jgi:hypothetical protein
VREAKARIKAARAAIARIDEVVEEEWVRPRAAERLRGLYEFRVRRFAARFDDGDTGEIEDARWPTSACAATPSTPSARRSSACATRAPSTTS